MEPQLRRGQAVSMAGLDSVIETAERVHSEAGSSTAGSPSTTRPGRAVAVRLQPEGWRPGRIVVMFPPGQTPRPRRLGGKRSIQRVSGPEAETSRPGPKQVLRMWRASSEASTLGGVAANVPCLRGRRRGRCVPPLYWTVRPRRSRRQPTLVSRKGLRQRRPGAPGGLGGP